MPLRDEQIEFTGDIPFNGGRILDLGQLKFEQQIPGSPHQEGEILWEHDGAGNNTLLFKPAQGTAPSPPAVVDLLLGGGGGGGPVNSVNSIGPGGGGNVSLTTDNMPEGTTNKYIGSKRTVFVFQIDIPANTPILVNNPSTAQVVLEPGTDLPDSNTVTQIGIFNTTKKLRIELNGINQVPQLDALFDSPNNIKFPAEDIEAGEKLIMYS